MEDPRIISALFIFLKMAYYNVLINNHIVPTRAGGNDDYKNLILVKEAVHRLIHAKTEETIQKYIALLKLNKVQLIRLNKYRVLAGNQELNLI